MTAERSFETPDVTRENIATWVSAYIHDGVEPNDAFSRVFDDLDRMGLLEDLARLIGVTGISAIWRKGNQAFRPAQQSANFRTIEPQQSMAPTTAPSTPSPPKRVVSIESLKSSSLLDGQYKVGDHWVRLGSMDKATCREAFRQYRKAAISEEHNARYFRAIEAVLEQKGGKVEDHFNDDTLMRLFTRCKP